MTRVSSFAQVFSRSYWMAARKVFTRCSRRPMVSFTSRTHTSSRTFSRSWRIITRRERWVPSLSLFILPWNLIISTLKWRNYDLFHSLLRIPSIKVGSRSIYVRTASALFNLSLVLAKGNTSEIEYYRKIWNYGTRNAELFIYLSFDVARGASGENCNRALIFPSSLGPSSLPLRRSSPSVLSANK